MNGRETGVTVKVQGGEVVTMDEFKYLGSTTESDGSSIREVKKRVQGGWSVEMSVRVI